jgi:hypothetical protein
VFIIDFSIPLSQLLSGAGSWFVVQRSRRSRVQ